MSIGSSGRIVIEIELNLKRELYSNLLAEGFSLKEWFVLHAKEYVAENSKSKQLKTKQTRQKK